MRFRKGQKVEVMNTKKVQISWRVAEILSGNGHTYHVKYDSYPRMANEQTVEIVSRKFLRPCPSHGRDIDSFTAGDNVEVFYEFSWKIAAILKVLEGKKETKSNKVQKQYLVRLFGSSKELIVDRLNIRMRQTWHDGKWIIMGKSSRGGDDVIASNPSTSNCHHKTNFTQSNAFQESPMISSRSLKRMSPYDSTIIEGRFQKVRAIEKNGNNEIKRRKIGNNEMGRRKISDIQTEPNNSDSDDCSVGSCSITDQSRSNYYIPLVPLRCQETETVCSDAESCYGSLCPKEEIGVSIRMLELHAYRRTLEALFASGPLSWEQEALLTNLRITLHISNDQHLMEVKHLISAKTAIHVR